MSKKFSAITGPERDALPDSRFAFIDKDGNRHLPIHDAAHVRDALSRINTVGGLRGVNKAKALAKIRAAAARFGVKTQAKEWARNERVAVAVIAMEMAETKPKYGPGGDLDWDDKEEPDESEDDTRPASEGCQGAPGCPCCASGDCTGSDSCNCGSLSAGEKVEPDGDDDDDDDAEGFDEGPTPPGGMTVADVHVPGPLNSEKGKKKKAKKASKDANGENVGEGSPQEGEVRKGSSHFITPDGSRSYLYFDLPPVGENETIPAGEWVHYRPSPGEFKSPRYGTIKITPESNREMVNNFNDGVYQEHVSIDAEHETKLSGAHGWLQKMKLEPDNSVWAYIEWNERGEKALSDKRFKYFSPEWYDRWEDPATGVVHKNVAVGGALTTRPFFKAGSLTPVLASELVPVTPNAGVIQMAKENETEATRLTEIESELEKERKQFAEALDTAQAEKKQLTERVEKAEGQFVSLTERLVAMETENRQREFREIVKDFPGETDKHIALMEQLNDEGRTSYIELQQAAAAQIKAGALATPIGNSPQGSGTSTTAGEAEKKMAQAKQAVKDSDGTLKLSEALAQAWEGDYDQYISETGN